MPRLVALLGVVAAFLCCGAGPATAHGQGPRIHAVVDRVSPAMPGVHLWVQNGLFTMLAVRNTTGKYLDVLGRDGEPFVRIGPAGVFANLNSAQWYLSSTPDEAASVPPAAERLTTPRWGRVSRRPQWAWFDNRLTTPAGKNHAHVRPGSRQVTRLGGWSMGLRYGGGPATVQGHLEYRPVLGTTDSRMTSPGRVAPGVDVRLLPGTIPALYLDNSTRRTVLVRGREGEPFARVGPGGTYVNRHSATYADDRRARGLHPAGPVDALRRPSWVKVADTSSYTWLESRASFAGRQPPEAAMVQGLPVTLGTWNVPLEIGGSEHQIEGKAVWTPLGRHGRLTSSDQRTGNLPSLPFVVGAAGVPVLLACVAAVGIRRFRDSQAKAARAE